MSHKIAATAGTRFLKSSSVAYRLWEYKYEEGGGTAHAAASLGLDEHAVIKTLVMETENASPLIILMHGDRRVSTRSLARQIGVREVNPCHPTRARKLTGYVVGGTSPFGIKTPMPVYIQRSILDLERIWINAGRRGLLTEIKPELLNELLEVVPVEVEQ